MSVAMAQLRFIVVVLGASRLGTAYLTVLHGAQIVNTADAPPLVGDAGIPAMSMNQRDQARRFITLVDELYNARCLLVCSAALPPDQLFAGTSGEEPILDLEGLQFEGAVEGGPVL
jgi:hypothetical protein